MKKLIKKISIISKIYFVGILGAIIIYFLKLFLNIKLVRIDTINYGRLFDNYNVLVESEKFFNKKDKIIFWFSSDKIANHYLAKLYKNKFKIYKYNFLFFATERVLDLIDSKLVFKIPDIFEFEKKIFLKKDYKKNFEKYGWNFENHIKLSKEDEKIGEEFLENYNLKKNDKWICIHNRDEIFKEKMNEFYEDQSHTHRNFSINDMKEAIEVFSNNGFFIFRVGLFKKEKISFKNKNLIDLEKNDDKNGFFQIYLSKYCTAYFGSSSGSSAPCVAFKKPVSYINFIPSSINISTFFRTLPSIPKRVKNISSGSYLTLKEICEEKLMGLSAYQSIKKKGLIHESNTSEDIKDLALEIVECLEHKENYDKESIELQNKYISIFSKYNKNQNIGLMPPMKIGKSFLKKHSEWLKE